MAFDYKKEYKDVYRPSKKPSLITMEPITYVAVRGKGNPNEVDGAYQQALQLLYGISFTIKMSPKAGVDLEGYFPYVVPPLEGFWSLSGTEETFSALQKDKLEWISCIRLPEFVTPEVFAWAKETAANKKKATFLLRNTSPSMKDSVFKQCTLAPTMMNLPQLILCGSLRMSKVLVLI